MGLRWVGCRLFEASKRLRSTPMGRDGGGATLEELLAKRASRGTSPPPSTGPSSASPRGDRRKAWLTPEQAREDLGLTPKQCERYAPRLPWRYLSERGVRYPVSELDAALEAAVRPETSVVNSRCDEKTGADGRDEVAEQGIGKGRKWAQWGLEGV